MLTIILNTEGKAMSDNYDPSYKFNKIKKSDTEHLTNPPTLKQSFDKAIYKIVAQDSDRAAGEQINDYFYGFNKPTDTPNSSIHNIPEDLYISIMTSDSDFSYKHKALVYWKQQFEVFADDEG